MEQKEKKIADAIGCIMDEKIGVAVENDYFSSTLEDFGLDSLDRVELCVEVERRFDIKINDGLMEEWGTMSIKSIAEQISFLITDI